MTDKRAFRAESGLDAGGHNVENVAYPRDSKSLDGVNVQYFIDKNTIQPFSETRDYPAQFAVHHLKRIWIAKNAITAGPFNSTEWEPTRTDPSWQMVTGTPSFEQGGHILQAGDYISAYSVNSELDFMLPSNPIAGDTIVIQDEGDYPHLRYIRVHTSARPIDDSKTVENFTIPGSVKTFVYSSTGGGRWICHTDVDGIRNQIITRGAQKNQLFAGGAFYRKSSTGRLQLQLPKYANDKDVITTFDLDELTPVNGVELHVHPDSDHSVKTNGTKMIVSNATGTGHFIYDAATKIWNIWDGDIRSRWKPVIGDSVIYPMEQIALTGGSGTVTLTLPKDAADGDFVKFSNIYDLTGVSVKFRVDPTTTHKIVGSKDNFIYPKYQSLPTTMQDYPLVSEIVTNLNYGTVLEFYYNGPAGVWLAADISTRIEHVDELNRDRPGVAPLASQAEVDKNHEQNPRDDMIVTPKTLANSTATETRRGIARIATAAELQVVTSGNHLNDVIVTPKRLNERQATETIRGVAEVATQTEANTSDNDTHIVTPKKLDARRATVNMAGVVKIIATGGTAATTRTNPGTGVYNWNDATHNEPFVLTPKSLNEAQATENSRGVGYIATQSEANAQTNANTSDAVLLTPRKLDNRRASETLAGIAEIATQSETNAGTLDTHIVSPLKLHNRRATETLHGLAEIATQDEVDAGALDTHIVSPLKFKTWNGYDHFTSTRTSGIKHSGNLWDKVTLDIDVATEAQRGTLEVATQAEANDMNGTASDIHIITPKKLSARKATESLTGIAEIATQTEVDAETDHTRIVTPKSLGDYIHSAGTAEMNETKNGTAHAASLAETWVGNTTDGSTQATSAYSHFPLAVTPRGLNHALSNYLPKTAKAVDSDKLDGLDSLQFLRSDKDGTLTGSLTIVKEGAPLSTSDGVYAHRLVMSGNQVYYQGGKRDGDATDQNMAFSGYLGKVLTGLRFYMQPDVSPTVRWSSAEHKIYHQGFKPTPAEIGAYTKAECDSKFVDVTGDTMTGQLKISRADNHISLVETDQSNKTWVVGLSSGTLHIDEVGVKTHLSITPSEFNVNSPLKATSVKVGSTIVIETDAKINWNKLKSVPAASITQPGIVQLDNSLTSTSQTTAPTSDAIRIIKEILDEKAGIEGAVMNDLKIKNWIRIGNVILRPNATNKTLDFIWTDDPM